MPDFLGFSNELIGGVGSVLTKLMTKSGGASIVASAVVSSMMTAAIALPMGATAISASDDAPELDVAIAIGDDRFPEEVDLTDAELAALLDGIETEVPDAPEPATEVASEPTGSADPTTERTSEAAPTPTPGQSDTDEFALVLPTPTARPAPSATPQPTRTPVPALPSPTIVDPTPPPEARPTPIQDPTAQPQPAPEPTGEAERSIPPTAIPVAPTATASPGPTAEPAPRRSPADVYAYVAPASVLVEDETATVFVKAVNDGPAATTQLVMNVNVDGATVLAIAADSSGWDCAGAGSSWVCRGQVLESRHVGLNVISLVPEADTVVVEVSISHAAPDASPGNDSITAVLTVDPT